MKPQSEQFKYIRAKTRVEKLKSFYRNLVLFIIVNLLLLGSHLLLNELNQFGTAAIILENVFFITLYFWGAFIVLHALWVFGLQYILGKNWEANQIEKYMKEEEQNQI